MVTENNITFFQELYVKMIKQYLPILLIAAGIFALWWLGWTKYLSFDSLRMHRSELESYVAAHPVAAPVLFTALYAIVAALAIPGATILTVAGGFFLPFPLNLICVVSGATIGAVCLFLAVRSAFGSFFESKAEVRLRKFQKVFKKNCSSCLLFMRLIPLFPFWLVNIGAAIFGASLSTFTWTTALGIIPATYVYTQAGRGLGNYLASDKTPVLSDIFDIYTSSAILVLVALSLLPLLFKKYVDK